MKGIKPENSCSRTFSHVKILKDYFFRLNILTQGWANVGLQVIHVIIATMRT